MPNQTHVNVTVDFGKWDQGQYDVRIPVYQPIKQLLVNLAETLNLDLTKASLFAVKVAHKELLLTDDDRLIDYPVTNGDLLLVL
ncbi:EsaB/YukD family protein [Neobacillus jeddahensis]|uniref:EsaB/YukD family protein n=1 Tax=Neobacillus jeddahensis TaxID=1461580 RepID=UPI00058CED4A|nr:EsaB/YukD family protein [Neobacillus jeddahensis]